MVFVLHRQSSRIDVTYSLYLVLPLVSKASLAQLYRYQDLQYHDIPWHTTMYHDVPPHTMDNHVEISYRKSVLASGRQIMSLVNCGEWWSSVVR